MKLLLDARDDALNQIDAERGGLTAYGEWRPVNEERKPRHVMAEICQSWEMKLIFPAFQLAQQTPDFNIMVFQHDGFHVHYTRRRDAWKRKIDDAINENANRQGFMTWLEWS